MDVEEVMAKGTSLPSGGNLQNMIGKSFWCCRDVRHYLFADPKNTNLKKPLLRKSRKGKSLTREHGGAAVVVAAGADVVAGMVVLPDLEREGSQPL
jgi:hypothetical protein